MEQNDSIRLGQAKNQAVQLTKIIYADTTFMTMEKYMKVYKDAVKLFWDANNELDAEILQGQPVKKDIPISQEVKKPSDKQKLCPSCGIPIPKTWTSHRKPGGCGWCQI